jgi:signal peptidase I
MAPLKPDSFPGDVERTSPHSLFISTKTAGHINIEAHEQEPGVRRPFLSIAVIAAGVGFIAFLLFDVKHVAGTSMEPSIHDRETVIVSRWHYGPRMPFAEGYLLRWRRIRTGDLVLVRHPVTGEEVIKRCAAAGGTRYRICRSRLYIDSRSYRLSDEALDMMMKKRSVPEDSIFVVGDNAQVSYDSRHYGPVDMDSIEGKVLHPERRRSK